MPGPESKGTKSSFQDSPQLGVYDDVQGDESEGEGLTDVEAEQFLNTPLDQLESYAGTIPNRTRRRTNG